MAITLDGATRRIILDSASVSAEVTLENKDIGFVTEGQDVAIKLET